MPAPSTRTRVLAGFAVLVTLLAACAAEPESVDDAGDAANAAIEQGNNAVGANGGANTGPLLGAPPPSPQPVVGPALPDEVEVHYPDLLVRLPAGTPPERLGDATATDQVTHTAALAEIESTVLEGQASHPVTALVVDPATFRPLTPEVTANVRSVWERLREGDVLVRHDVAHRLGLELGGNIRLAGADGPVTARVGAFASNGAPPLADLVIPWSRRAALGVDAPDTLVISVAEDASATDVHHQILHLVEDADVTLRERPSKRQAALAGGPGIRRFEAFTYLDLGDGLIVIDASWVREWIVTVDLPFLGRTRCHRLMVPQLVEALVQIGDEGLQGQLDPDQFAGCWVPRHIDWNPAKPLSMHAWGLAVDINSHDNPLGQRPRMHPRIVEIFRSWGFEWGGTWSRPDGMHFELERLISTS